MKRGRRLERKPKVCEAMGWSNSTLYQKIKDGLFVPPVKLGPRTSTWPSDVVAALQDIYVAEKPQEQIRALVRELKAARKGVL
jgi:prophage regulatory protein